jgi:hypothetical protein
MICSLRAACHLSSELSQGLAQPTSFWPKHVSLDTSIVRWVARRMRSSGFDGRQGVVSTTCESLLCSHADPYSITYRPPSGPSSILIGRLNFSGSEKHQMPFIPLCVELYLPKAAANVHCPRFNPMFRPEINPSGGGFPAGISRISRKSSSQPFTGDSPRISTFRRPASSTIVPSFA